MDYDTPMENKPNKTTDFGYKKVPIEEKAERVHNVFASVASKYDIMNDLMSLGIHRLWKHFAINISHFRQGQRVLDLAGGTGDLCIKISKLVGETGHVILADINDAMLKVGRDRLLNQGLINNTTLVLTDAEKLPFADNTFDRIIIGFGLRNVTHKDRALQSMYRCLKPGGMCLVLEFSTPTNSALKKIYDLYSFKILPKLGALIANDADSYQYLAESIRMHPDQKNLREMMLTAGFDECHYHNLSGGIVAVHRGVKY